MQINAAPRTSPERLDELASETSMVSVEVPDISPIAYCIIAAKPFNTFRDKYEVPHKISQCS